MNRTWYHLLLMYLWLTVGYASVHIAFILWFVGICSSIWPRASLYEHLWIDSDGEPVVQYWARGHGDVEFRRLDGTPLPNLWHRQNRRIRVDPATIHYRPVGVPASWEQRIDGYRDFETPTTFWYHVEPSDRSGTSYFEGFDKSTRRPIGFLGVNGFSALRPSHEQSFPIRSSSIRAKNGIVASIQRGYQQAVVPIDNSAFECENASVDTLWLLSNDTIYEILLNARTVRALPTKINNARFLTTTTVVRAEKTYVQLLIRSDTGLVLLNPSTNDLETIPLPPIQPTEWQYEQFYQTDRGHRILVRTLNETTTKGVLRVDLSWIGDNLNVERHAEATLQYPNIQVEPRAIPLCAPSPIVSYGALFFAPHVVADPAENKETATYLGHVKKFVSEMWAWLLVSSIAGVASGWGCLQRERDVFGRAGWFWPILVGLSGWFGWVGYIFLQPLPARLSNREWIKHHPEPNVPLGSEIFA